MVKIEDMVEVTLGEKDDFLKVRETLTRIGVASKKEKILYQSCHILHKQGKYYIVHFKELFSLDGKPTDITENDLARRNTVTNLLADWELVKIVDEEKTKDPPPMKTLRASPGTIPSSNKSKETFPTSQSKVLSTSS